MSPSSIENVRIKLFSRPYKTVEDSPCTGKSSCLHPLPVGNDLHRQCISCLCQPVEKPLSWVFNFDKDMQQVRRMTPFYNSGLCMSALSCDQGFIVLKLLDYKSNQTCFCLFFLAEKQEPVFRSPFRLVLLGLRNLWRHMLVVSYISYPSRPNPSAVVLKD